MAGVRVAEQPRLVALEARERARGAWDVAVIIELEIGGIEQPEAVDINDACPDGVAFQLGLDEALVGLGELTLEGFGGIGSLDRFVGHGSSLLAARAAGGIERRRVTWGR